MSNLTLLIKTCIHMLFKKTWKKTFFKRTSHNTFGINIQNTLVIDFNNTMT